MTVLLTDLQCPIVSVGGPLSFERIAGIGSDEAQSFAGKTFLKLLTSPRTSRGALEQLAAFGKSLGSSRLPDSTCLAGRAIYALARLALHTRYGCNLAKGEAQAAAELVKALSAAK